MTPEGKTADLHKMMQLGEKGVLALLSDSTNSEREGQSLSEHTVGKSVLELIQQCEGRVLFATFASMSTGYNKLFMLLRSVIGEF